LPTNRIEEFAHVINRKISIALPPEMVAQVRQAVETGDYASSSEVVRDALRDWTHKRQLQQNGLAELRPLSFRISRSQ
jgi:antitoxin ParD1/3/4